MMYLERKYINPIWKCTIKSEIIFYDLFDVNNEYISTIYWRTDQGRYFTTILSHTLDDIKGNVDTKSLNDVKNEVINVLTAKYNYILLNEKQLLLV